MTKNIDTNTFPCINFKIIIILVFIFANINLNSV